MKLRKFVKIKNQQIIVDNKTITSNDLIAKDFKDFTKQVYTDNNINYRKFFKMDKLSKIGFLTSELLLKDVDLSMYEPEEIAVILVNSSASLNTDKDYQKTVNEIPSPAVFVYTLPNIILGEISIRNNFKGESLFLVSENFDYDFLHNYSQYLMDKQQQKIVILGWVEIDMLDNYESFLYLFEN